MSALTIAIASIILFFLAYRFYGRWLQQLWAIDPGRPTPAFSKYDSIDYIPAKNWLVLFGHHFASIAGAGPIIGPVIAVMLWGWLPALLWVVAGSIFIGGIHDFGSLLTSVRSGGSSVSDIAGEVISKRARIIFCLFVWLALILVIAVFAYLSADTLVKEPRVVLPSLGLIPVAMLAGYFLYHLRLNAVLTTVFGLGCLVILLFLGNAFPVTNSLLFWLIILLIYAYFASVLPVNLLLQPRDYLSSFLLFFGIGIGYISVVLFSPRITLPYYRAWAAEEGYLWPALFVTVACGAVSGFHALISSGTSSKQIANERDAKKIGYGGMLAEGLMAVLAIIAVAVLFKPGDNLGALLKSKGPIAIFAQGYGQITQGILGNYGAFIALTILNAFILTTLDTATRIARYLTEELFKIKNRYLSTGLIVVLSGSLAASGKWSKIWPAFGASNQLVAALTLLVLTCWLLAKKKNAKFTFLPALFMLLTTSVALFLGAVRYFMHREIILFVISLILIILAGVMAWETMPLYVSGLKSLSFRTRIKNGR